MKPIGMKTLRTLTAAALGFTAWATAYAAQAQTPDPHGWVGTEKVETRYGNFEFKNGYPTAEAADKLYELRTFNRAVEAYLSQLPAISMFYMRKGLKDLGADASNKFAIFETRLDSQSLFLTANTETVYGLSFLDLKRDGPTVVEAPAMMLGGAVDIWSRYVVDIGPSGPDKGKGGKFLFVPPDYGGAIPEGYFVVKCPTYGIWLGVRGFLVDGKPDQAVALMKTARIYALADAPNPPAMVYLNGSGKPMDTIFPDTYAFFASLAELIEQEPAEAIPPSDRFTLASIGIEKGKPFNPDAGMKKLLDEAARVGAAMARVNTFASRDAARVVYPDRRWEWAFLGGSYSWDAQGYVNADQRAAWFYTATGDSPAMVLKVVGAGSQYIWTPRDASGAFLDGGKSYRLHLPSNIPVKLFWSVVVYDALSRSELQNGERFPSISQYTGPAVNTDGSVDIFFGPQVATGKEKNWIKTVPGRGWFPYMRFYSPTEAFFDKTWKPDDIVEVKR